MARSADRARILVRPAVSGDALDLFTWRNDPATRAASVSQGTVTWAAHRAWLQRALGDPRRMIYIAQLADAGGMVQSVGMCRFDLPDSAVTAEVSINLNPAYRGRGLAAEVLDAAIGRFYEDAEASVPLIATIRNGNNASARVFEKNGFVKISADSQFGHFVRNQAMTTEDPS